MTWKEKTGMALVIVVLTYNQFFGENLHLDYSAQRAYSYNCN